MTKLVYILPTTNLGFFQNIPLYLATYVCNLPNVITRLDEHKWQN